MERRALMQKILIVTSEAIPFAKTGGLSDVAGSLPKALNKLGTDARVIMPKYEYAGKSKKRVPDEDKEREEVSEYKTLTEILNENQLGLEHLCHIYISLGWRELYCGIEKTVYQGVTYYFIDNEYYFRRENCYGYEDDTERFAYFSRAVLEALPYLDFLPDILHCNDWQTGMIPALLSIQYRSLDDYRNIRTIFTIHNLKFQGIYGIEEMKEWFGLGDEYFTPDTLELYGAGSFMKGGLVYSDILTTVSETYANEIKNPFYGERLDGLLRARQGSLYGILNGIDYELYNPKTDPYLYHNYTKSNLKGKLAHKLLLQRELGLEENADIPMIGLISRLTDQKGLDLIACVFEEIMKENIQFVVLGSGEHQYEQMFLDRVEYETKRQQEDPSNPRRIYVEIGYNDPLSHKIYAASDFFLMPSLFEPCGLGQLISMRYGTLPIVRETGGLKDTVLSYNEETGEGNGFSFANYNAHDMLYTIQRALRIYKKKTLRKKLVHAAMSFRSSWDHSAEKYLELYKKLIL
jgi:starch synthase